MELLTAVKEALAGDDADAGERTPTDLDRPSASTDSVAEIRSGTSYASEIDFAVATGRTRNEALLELVEAHEGQVKQAELVELTGWSKATVSRRLGKLEDVGAIERVPVGRCKVVLLPGESIVADPAVAIDTRG